MLVNKLKKEKQLILKYGVNKGYKFLIDYFYLQKHLKFMKIKGANGFVPFGFFSENLSDIFLNYLYAEYYFYKGDFDSSKKYLSKNLGKKHEESYYLLSEIYRSLGLYDKALELLYGVLVFSKRGKTWLYISRNIHSKESFNKFNVKFDALILSKNKRISYDLISYYSDAAMNAKEYNTALNVWTLYSNKIIKKKRKKVFFTIDNANKALKDLRRTLGVDNFFLVSGTLLGIVRDGTILKHDKDLDVGVFLDNSGNTLSLLQKSGYFEILPCRTPYQLKVKHFNGIYIDVFLHKKVDNFYWHYTSKIKWFNREFNLVKYFYDDEYYFIPEDYKVYLEENYGASWIKPVKKFDSTFDTPNSVIYNEFEMKLFEIKQKFIQSF